MAVRRGVFVSALAVTVVLSARAATAQDAARGAAVYSDQKCALCHSVAGKGNPKGPLDDVGSRLSAADIRTWLTNPAEMAEKSKSDRKPAMRPYASLPPADLSALVAYLQTLKK